MENLTYSPEGFIHLISSIAALALGTLILIITKGIGLHKNLGYGYVISMVVLNFTAFAIYRLFGRFGPFHIAAIASSATLLAGIIPPLFFRHKKSWVVFHFTFMYYSVIGLYAAFASEIIVRLPGVRFWWSVAGATVAVVAIGVYVFKKQSKKWAEQFNSRNSRI
jgi:uncharacterized membrane protein